MVVFLMCSVRGVGVVWVCMWPGLLVVCVLYSCVPGVESEWWVV